MSTTPIPRPSVEVYQEITQTTVRETPPLLPACIVGPAFEILEALKEDGTLNADARYSDSYTQFPVTIAQTSFPDPRGNILELNIDETTIKAYLYFLSSLNELPTRNGYGDAFLAAYNHARRAAIICTKDFTAGINLDGMNLALSIDNPFPQVFDNDITVVFDGISLDTQDIADQINDAVGQTVAYVLEYATDAYKTFIESVLPGPVYYDLLALVSPTWGAKSSITVREGGAANEDLGIGWKTVASTSCSQRVTGTGFCAEDDYDGDTTSPWITFQRGSYYEWTGDWPDDPTTIEDIAVPLATTGLKAWYQDEQDEFSEYTTSKHPAVTFGDGKTIHILKYDLMYGDGTLVGAAKIMKVEETRFRMGVTNIGASTIEDGYFVNEVLTGVEVKTFSDPYPFCPRKAWFQATYLDQTDTAPLNSPAYLVGTRVGDAATYGEAISITPKTGPFNLTGLSLKITQTYVDAITGEQVEAPEQQITFTGAHADMASVATYLSTELDYGSATIVAGPAVLDSTAALTFPMNVPAGSSFDIAVTVGMVTTTYNVTVPGVFGVDPDIVVANMAALLELLDDHTNPIKAPSTLAGFSGVEFSNNGGKLRLTTHDEGENVSFTVDDRALFGTWSAALLLLPQAPTASQGTSYLVVKTNGTGPLETVKVARTFTGAANSALGFATSTDTTGTGEGITFPREVATTQSSTDVDWAAFEAIGAGGGGSGLIINYRNTDGVTVVKSLANVNTTTIDTREELLTYLNTPANWTGAALPPVTFSFNEQRLVVTGNSTMGHPFCWFYFTATTSIWAAALKIDTGILNIHYGKEGLSGARVRWTMNDDPYIYEVTAATDSMYDLIEKINDELGWPMGTSAYSISTSYDEKQFALLSFLPGYASKVEAYCDTDELAYDATVTPDPGIGTAEQFVRAVGLCTYTYGVGGTTAALVSDIDGTGRPDPDAYIEVGTNNLVLSGEILRDQVTGYPFQRFASGMAQVYLPYKALRLDVSPVASSPKVLSFSDTADLEDRMNPVTSENPLALGIYFSMINSPDRITYGIGVDEVSALEPEGTQFGYTKAFEFIESSDVYSVVPLTYSQMVHQVLKTHVETMSLPENKGERVALICAEDPVYENPTVLSSGTGATAAASLPNVLMLDSDPTPAIIAAGIDPTNILPEDNLYVQVSIQTSTTQESRNYLVTAINSTAVEFNTTFASDENLDNFYTVTPLALDLTGVDWSMKIRGESLTLTGSNPPRRDLDAVAETVAGMSHSYSSRRVLNFYPDSVTSSPSGIEEVLPGYYAACCVAGMTAALMPDQPFTEYPITGLTGCPGTNDTFRESQLDIIAGGGTYILIQEGEGTAVKARQQLTTDVTSIYTQEYSITRALDAFAKYIRRTFKPKIGRNNITPKLLDELSIMGEGCCRYACGPQGWLKTATLQSITQSTDSPDTVEVVIIVEVRIPCNKIKVRIRV